HHATTCCPLHSLARIMVDARAPFNLNADKQGWVLKECPAILAISDADWAAAQARWRKIEGMFSKGEGKDGFEGKRKSSCGGALPLVSGKGSGYYGWLNSSRRSCDNKVLIPRGHIEDKFIQALNDVAKTPDPGPHLRAH